MAIFMFRVPKSVKGNTFYLGSKKLVKICCTILVQLNIFKSARVPENYFKKSSPEV